MKHRITLTDEEIQLIQHALRIAVEDGSIYGWADTDEETINKVESLSERLSAALNK